MIKKHGSRYAYRGFFNVRLDDITLDNGVRVNFHVIEATDFVSVLPIIENDIILVRQYRPAINEYHTELPAGGINDGELPEQTAVRELKEETGYIAKNLELLCAPHPLPGMDTQKSYIFVAKNLIPGEQKLDPEEHIDVLKIPYAQVIKDVINGQCTDGLLCLAICMYDLKKRNALK